MINLAAIDLLASYAFPTNERLIYNQIKPVIESVLPEEQVDFRSSSCTLDQVALLTEDTRTSFGKTFKAGFVFVDISAAMSIFHMSSIVTWL